MPLLERGSNRIVIAGASSLLGAELRSLLEESRFAGAEFRLVDEEIAAGLLTEAGGEPAIIRPVEEGTFDRAAKVFFTGSADFTRANLEAARASSAKIIDLSGATAAESKAVSWFPKLDSLHGRKFPKDANLYAVPSAAGTAIASLALGLFKIGVSRIVAVCFQAVSEAGGRGSRGVGEPDRTIVVVSRNGTARVRHTSRFQSVGPLRPRQQIQTKRGPGTITNRDDGLRG
jgi:aspartate-semialdehyde dehydrogenase